MDDVGFDLDAADRFITVRRLAEGDRGEVELLCGTRASGLGPWFDPGAEALSRSRSAAVVDGLLLGFDGPYGLTGAVRDNASGALIGLVSLQRRAARTVELTYWVARPWRGQGVATRAARLASRRSPGRWVAGRRACRSDRRPTERGVGPGGGEGRLRVRRDPVDASSVVAWRDGRRPALRPQPLAGSGELLAGLAGSG